MDPLVLIIASLLAVVAASALAFSARRASGPSERDYEAEAEIEAHDIDQMIEARNERRRAAGRPEIGEEMAAEIRRELDD
jgi:hypothetical protein